MSKLTAPRPITKKRPSAKRRWPTWGESECRIRNIEIAKCEAIRRASLPHAAKTPCNGGASYHVFALCADARSVTTASSFAVCGAIR